MSAAWISGQRAVRSAKRRSSSATRALATTEAVTIDAWLSSGPVPTHGLATSPSPSISMCDRPPASIRTRISPSMISAPNPPRSGGGAKSHGPRSKVNSGATAIATATGISDGSIPAPRSGSTSSTRTAGTCALRRIARAASYLANADKPLRLPWLPVEAHSCSTVAIRVCQPLSSDNTTARGSKVGFQLSPHVRGPSIVLGVTLCVSILGGVCPLVIGVSSTRVTAHCL
jgi:hypothetical protein